MRICIFGAGATGGHFATKLAMAGHDVSVVARGPNLTTIRQHGLSLQIGDQEFNAVVKASDDSTTLGIQDLVIIGLKATGLKSISPQIAPLLKPESLVIFPQNGMPWWYPHGLPEDRPRPPNIPIFSLSDEFLAVMRPGQVLGGVIYSANELVSPGVVKCRQAPFDAHDISALCLCAKYANMNVISI